MRTGQPHYDLAVVGAGIVGLAHARAAVARGWSVVVLDRSERIQGATVRNFGHLCITPQTGQAREYAERGREIWLSLAQEAGFWLRESGTIVVARAPDELEVLAEAGEGVLLEEDEIRALVPIAHCVGGAFLPRDLQVDPREAGPAIARRLAVAGVEFRWCTSALGIEPGVIHSSRGEIAADRIVVAVNHDVDHLDPAIADRAGILRCGLDMIMVDAELRFALPAPVLTGWSLLRYSGFASTPSAVSVRSRLSAERPDLIAMDLNQMYTQRLDGGLIIGDTHYRGLSISPFQPESSFEALRRITEDFFGVEGMTIRERWQGVYASAAQEFLIEAPADNIRFVSVTSGIGMTTGLGLGQSVVDQLAL